MGSWRWTWAGTGAVLAASTVATAPALGSAAKAAAPAAAKVAAAQFVGDWHCAVSTVVSGVVVRIEGPQTYTKDGISQGSGTVTYIGPSGNALKFATTFVGGWRVRGADLCETLGQFEVSPANPAARSERGQAILATLTKSFTTATQTRKETCNRVTQLDDHALIGESLENRAWVTRCTR